MPVPETGEVVTVRPKQSSRNDIDLPSGIAAETVKEQLERILLSPFFRNSKRNSNLLKHIVEAALTGETDTLRERSIGVAVFGRAVDYDTGSDHIVRSVAGEVRRRLAQYYVESDPQAAIRFELLPGSYVPQFRPNGEKSAGARTVGAAEADVIASPAIASVLAKPQPRISRRTLATAALAVLAVAALFAGYELTRVSPLQRFWGPLFGSGDPVLLCVGGSRVQPGIGSPKSVIEFVRDPAQMMHTNDAIVLASVTGLLQANGRAYRILNRASQTSFKDLQSGPFVLIGGLNNEWALRLTRNFRFSLATTLEGAVVLDREHPSNRAWRVDPNAPVEMLTRDYAVISRFRDSETERTAVVIAAIGPWAMLAAGEFLTKTEFLKKIESFAPSNWSQKHLQLVITTDVIHGSSGPPKILAAHFW